MLHMQVVCGYEDEFYCGYEDVDTSGMTCLVLGNIEYGSGWQSHGVGMRHFAPFSFCLSFIVCTGSNSQF
jgi:hypothetical protein